jgi:glycosyltransferase involved in cell wall biosynthesis
MQTAATHTGQFTRLPIFLTIVCVVRNSATLLQNWAEQLAAEARPLVRDYDILFVDNASEDESLAVLEKMTGVDGFANIQVFGLATRVDQDTAVCVGLESALGDYVAVVDPLADDIKFLKEMLCQAVLGADVVFAKNSERAPQTFFYTFANALFNRVYKQIGGVDLNNEAPRYRVLARKVINFLLKHPRTSIMYRHLPVTAGFVRVNLSYSKALTHLPKKRIINGIDRGMEMLVSSTRAPMRLVTGLSLFGAYANLVYSLYVVVIALLKEDVAPGWISMSLQQSGMFFLISLVLMVLGEYILMMVSLSGKGPTYRIAQEFTSAQMTRCKQLNISSADIAEYQQPLDVDIQSRST